MMIERKNNLKLQEAKDYNLIELQSLQDIISKELANAQDLYKYVCTFPNSDILILSVVRKQESPSFVQFTLSTDTANTFFEGLRKDTERELKMLKNDLNYLDYLIKKSLGQV